MSDASMRACRVCGIEEYAHSADGEGPHDFDAERTPKLRAFLSAVEPDGTVVVHVSRSGEVTPIESLLVTTRRMDAAFGMCLSKAGWVAMSLDELDDMVDMSMRAVQWLQSCCAQLGLEVFQ